MSTARPTAAAAHITAHFTAARVAGCRVIRTKVVATEDMAGLLPGLHRVKECGVGGACTPRPPTSWVPFLPAVIR
ncbi:hypothetical protein GFS60_07970 (plasmid) [Rhodococcus sp. WAY2]|nr:hypothetical protein GFS60_07970 [Rhodococcus sp. WAY2]